MADRSVPTRVLVIGCGNDLRSDDRAGRVVAERVGARDLAGVAIRSVTQLVPELALDVAEADHVVFVDASVEVETVTVTELTPADAATRSTHHASPARLLALAAQMGTCPRPAHVVSLPVGDLGLGERMSPVATAGVERAVELICELVRDGRLTPHDTCRPPDASH